MKDSRGFVGGDYSGNSPLGFDDELLITLYVPGIICRADSISIPGIMNPGQKAFLEI